MSLLQVSGLRKSFGGVHAVQGVSFTLRAGELLALIGPNGAGKTTTFQMMGGQLLPDAGRVLLDGQDITGRTARALAGLGVGRTFQIAETLTSFTALANVQMALLAHDGRWRGLWRKAEGYRSQDALALLDQVGMAAQAGRPCSELAYGDVKRLELALALAGQPRLLLMDEPTAGMAPGERVALMQLVRQLARDRQIGVLFTEHSMDVVFGQADRIAVMVRGELLAEGSPQAIQQDARVQAAYLGNSENNSLQRAPYKAESPETPLLSVEGLNAWYGAAQILHGVSLNVRRGEVLALMGRNGAGKSTTLKSIAGLLARTSGRRSFLGEDITRWPAHRIARAGLGYVPEERRIFGDLTVLENLETGRQSPRRWPDGTALEPWTVQRLFALFPNLRAMPDRPGARMSGGEQQMLTVARTLMGQPVLVLLDEPSEGVAPVIVEQMVQAVRALKASGIAIVLSEQNLAFAEAVADRVLVIAQGRTVHEAAMADFAADRTARQELLGIA